MHPHSNYYPGFSVAVPQTVGGIRLIFKRTNIFHESVTNGLTQYFKFRTNARGYVKVLSVTVSGAGRLLVAKACSHAEHLLSCPACFTGKGRTRWSRSLGLGVRGTCHVVWVLERVALAQLHLKAGGVSASGEARKKALCEHPSPSGRRCCWRGS